MSTLNTESPKEYYQRKRREIAQLYDDSYCIGNAEEERIKQVLSTYSLLYESVRLDTFHFFREKGTRDIEKMAKNGFYYNRAGDVVICYFCYTVLRKKNNYEEPRHHGRFFDKCAMAKYPFNGNVPMSHDLIAFKDSFDYLNCNLEDLMLLRIEEAHPVKELVHFNGAFANTDKRLDFSTYEGRLSSYEIWFEYLEIGNRPNKESYAKAGFVFSGFSDFVVCFNCKGGLFNLHKDDDPVREHATFYWHCSFIQDYCMRNKIDISFSKTEGKLYSISEGDHCLLYHPMINNLTATRGYDVKTTDKWIRAFVNTYCCFPADLTMCKKGLDQYIKGEKLEKEKLEKEKLDKEKLDKEKLEKEKLEKEESEVVTPEREPSLKRRKLLE